MSKKFVPPTFEQRLAGAQAQASAALSVFDGVIADLNNSAVEKYALIDDIDFEIARLSSLIEHYLELSAEAERDASAALNKAASIRSLLGN